MCVYVYVCRSRHAKKMLNYLDHIEPEAPALSAYVNEMATATGSDEDTGFGTESTQTTTSTSTSATTTTSIGSELFGGLFNIAMSHKDAEVAAPNTFASQQHHYQQQHQQHHQQQHHQLNHQLQQFHYPGLLLQLHQEDGGGGGGRGGGKHLKRRKLECNQVELNNDDACSEDEFIRKIATVTADSQEASSQDASNGSATRIISVETVSNSNNKTTTINNNNNGGPK